MLKAFADAFRINFENIFLHASNILESLPSVPNTERALSKLYEAAEFVCSRAALLKQDLTGRIYHSALGKTIAKNFATYYTRIPPSELLAWIGITKWDDKVADFACGSGTLLTSAYHRKLMLAFPDCVDRGVSDVKELHRKFVEEDIWGFDAMSFAAHLTMVNLALQYPQKIFKKSHIFRVPTGQDSDTRVQYLGSLDLLDRDYLDVRTRLVGEETGPVEQTISLRSEIGRVDVPKNYFDLVVMNPPFTRGDRATQVLNTRHLNQKLKEIKKEGIQTHMTGLAAPFVILADLYVKSGGRMAFVLPTAILSRETWSPIREMLAEKYHLEHLIVSWADGLPSFSEDSALREILLVARKLLPKEKAGYTIVSHVDKDVNFMQMREISERLEKVIPENIGIRTPSSQLFFSGLDIFGEAKSFPPGLIKEGLHNWYQLLAFRSPELVRTCLAFDGLLGDPGYGLSREIIGVFSSLEEVAIVNWYMRYTSSAGFIVVQNEPPDGGTPYLSTSAYNRLTFNPEHYSDWIIKDSSIETTRSFKIETGILHVPRKTDIVNTMRVSASVSEEGVIGSMWHPVIPKKLVTKDGNEISAYDSSCLNALWLQSTLGLIYLIGNRQETRGGYGEWKTNQIKRVKVLDPSKLNIDQIKAILNVWEDVRDIEWDLLRNQLQDIIQDENHPRRRLDYAISEALMGGTPERLDNLYIDLSHTIDRLAAVMRKRRIS